MLYPSQAGYFDESQSIVTLACYFSDKTELAQHFNDSYHKTVVKFRMEVIFFCTFLFETIRDTKNETKTFRNSHN